MRDVVKFIAADVFEIFAPGDELLVNLDGLFIHGIVGFLRAADEGEIGPGGQPFVAIGIKTDSEDERLLIPFFSHSSKVNSLSASSSGKPLNVVQAILTTLFSRKAFSLQGRDFLKPNCL
jgi:hypothetical protein